MTNVNVYSLPSTIISAAGNSGDLSVETLTELILGVNVTAIDATATLTVAVSNKGADGVYYPLYTATITAVGLTEQSIGPGLENAKSFGEQVQVSWTVTATKHATCTISLQGK